MTDPHRPAGASGEQALHDHTDIAVRKYAVPACSELDVLSAGTRIPLTHLSTQ